MSTVEQWERSVLPITPPAAQAPEHPRAEPAAWRVSEELPPYRVAVVRRENVEEDTSAWDVVGSGVAWLTLFAGTGSGDAVQDGPAGSGYVTWRRDANVTLPRDDEPVRCGGPVLTAEESAVREAELLAEEAPPPEEDEESERTSADLLVRNDSAWGDGAAPPPGVLG